MVPKPLGGKVLGGKRVVVDQRVTRRVEVDFGAKRLKYKSKYLGKTSESTQGRVMRRGKKHDKERDCGEFSERPHCFEEDGGSSFLAISLNYNLIAGEKHEERGQESRWHQRANWQS